MPFGDGTGPGGMGPMTGRGAGYCAGYSMPGFMNPYGGRGLGMGWGRGWGRGVRGFPPGGYGFTPYAPPGYGPMGWAAPSRESEIKMLQNQADRLREQMEAVDERIEELQKEQG